MVTSSRPRRHARRPRCRLSLAGRRVSPLRQGGDAGSPDGARCGRGTADRQRAHQAGTAPPAPGRTHPHEVVPPQRRRRPAIVLRRRRRDGARRTDRADGVGHLAGDAGKRPGCAHPCDPPRRQGRATGRRKRAGAPGAAGGVRGRRWRAADQERRRHDPVPPGSGEWRRARRRHRDHRTDRRVGVQPPRHVPQVAEASAGFGRRPRAALEERPPRRGVRVEDRRRPDRCPGPAWRRTSARVRPRSSPRVSPTSIGAPPSWPVGRSWNDPGCS